MKVKIFCLAAVLSSSLLVGCSNSMDFMNRPFNNPLVVPAPTTPKVHKPRTHFDPNATSVEVPYTDSANKPADANSATSTSAANDPSNAVPVNTNAPANTNANNANSSGNMSAPLSSSTSNNGNTTATPAARISSF